MSRDSTT